MSKEKEVREAILYRSPPEDKQELTLYMAQLAREYSCDISTVRAAVRYHRGEAAIDGVSLREHVRLSRPNWINELVREAVYYFILSEDLSGDPLITDEQFIGMIPQLIEAIARDYLVDREDLEQVFERIRGEAQVRGLSINEHWNQVNGELKRLNDQLKKLLAEKQLRDPRHEVTLDPFEEKLYMPLKMASFMSVFEKARDGLYQELGARVTPYLYASLDKSPMMKAPGKEPIEKIRPF